MMTCIVIAGSQDSGLETLIKNELTKSYSVTYIKNNEIFASGSGYELVFADLELPKLINLQDSLIIAKNNAVLPEGLPKGSTVILNAENTRQLETAVGCGVYAVDCGHSQKCTVSFSGKSDDTLLVSLNRSIIALSGREIQPLEIPMPKNSDDYTIMSFVALRLLLDDHDSELGRLM